MQQCLILAAHGQRSVYPNPRVGAVVISKEGELLGQGWHARYGEHHAEPAAIDDALKRHSPGRLSDSTLYVNLEPCNHSGKQPPCVGAILKHGINRVVVGMPDPNPKARDGAEALRARGVSVTMGVMEKECRRFNEPFLHSLNSTRPLVSLKLAQTLDGRVATATGHSQWITGISSRTRVHQMRAEADAIMTGSGTARADNPSLTVRHVSGPDPRRFVMDRTGTLPPDLKLFTDGIPTTAIVRGSAHPAYEHQLEEAGGAVLRIPEKEGHLDLEVLLQQLDVHTLMVESGPGLATALLLQDLVDRVFIFVAPKIIGGGLSSIDGLNVQTMDQALTFVEHDWEQVGKDFLFSGYLRTV